MGWDKTYNQCRQGMKEVIVPNSLTWNCFNLRNLKYLSCVVLLVNYLFVSINSMYLLVMVVACWYQIAMGLSTDQQFKPGHAGY